MRLSVALTAAIALAACAPSRPAEIARPAPPRVIVIHARAPVAHPLPHPIRIGRIRKVPPPDMPAASADRFAQHNLDRINMYRQQAGLTPLVLDAKLSAFALEGSKELKSGKPWHGHIGGASKEELDRAGFRGYWAENQGGESRALPDPVANEERQIEHVVDGMMKEGPGGGHHDNIMAPGARRLGVGIVEDPDGGITLTNDFSGE